MSAASNAERERAAAAISDAGEVALVCHVNPDGDALGSMLGLFHVLRAAAKPTIASFPSPFVVAPHYRNLPGLELITAPHEFPVEPDVVVTFDSGSLERLGDLEPAAKAARELIVIDHHISNDRYGTINVIEPNAAASGWVVLRLIDTLGLPLVRDAAVCLYAALICDTGRFQYDTTTPEVFDMARRLTEFDVPVAEVTRPMFERYGVTLEEVEGLIDILRRTTEAEVTCVLKEEADGTVRVSLRSLGNVDVRRIAEAHGGGGHRFAAGFTSALDPETVVARIRAAL